MTLANALPALPVAMPLLGAALISALRKWLPRRAVDALGLLIAALTLTACVLLLRSTLRAPVVYWFGNWFPRGSMVLGIGFLAEPVGAGLATLAALLTFLALLFSWRYVDCGQRHSQTLMLVFLAAMCGFSLTADLFNMFVFFELMSTAAFALCGLKTAEPAPLQGSFNFAVTNTVAAFLILTGISFLYAATGALNMAQIGLALGPRHDPLVLFACTLLTCGFLVKAAIVPFHLWLPDAHAVAPTPVCVLFSGLMVELGLYGAVKLHVTIFQQALAWHPHAFAAILYGFAAVTILLGGVMCYAEHHLKRMLAYSTICHAGLMLLAYAAGGALGIAAMLVYILAHAFVKSGLFFLSGVLLHNQHSISERELFGKGKRLRVTGLLWFLGGAGLAAAPGFATMVGEAGASKAAHLSGIHGVELLFILGGTLTGAAVFRVGMHTFFGWGSEPITDEAAEVGELPETKLDRVIHWYHCAPPLFCMAVAIALTFTHGWLPPLRAAAANFASQPVFQHVLYTGQKVQWTMPGWRDELAGSAVRGAIATLLALALALTSVFRLRVPRALRAGARLECGFRPLRAMQSGHPGDYVAWLTVGLAAFGSAAMFLLRS